MSRPVTRPIQVMIVDGSALVRQVIASAVNAAPGMEVLATASDPLFAMNRLRNAHPDVIILDIEMPRMDGLSFLRHIMAERPTPVIVCSSLAERGSETAMAVLAAGAFTIVTKPRAGIRDFLAHAAADILSAIRAAALAKPRLLTRYPAPPADVPAVARTPPALPETTDKVIALGTSTGGTQALEAVLTRLPASVAGIVIVQHMPERFTALFAERLNSLCALEVREARHNDRLLRGQALVAPGGRHLMLKRSGAQYQVEVADGPVVSRHKPSVDVLFRSVARFAGRSALGVIMTGMGDDGARGLREMRISGAVTIAQDEASSVVFGMPKEAIKLGAAESVLSLDDIPAALVRFSCGSRR